MFTQLTINGIFLYDNTIFDDLATPKGIDRYSLAEWIMNECGELSLVYTPPQFLKNKIRLWSNIRLKSWQKLYDTTILEYNPIYNYDRKEDNSYTKHQIFYEDIGYVGSQNESHDNTTTSNSRNGGSDVNELQRSAFDSESYVNDERNTATYGSNNSATGNIKGSNNLKNENKTSKNNDFIDSGTDTVRVYGNIGVTTTQKMINDERKVVLFDVYNHIVEEFKKEFCILVY